MITVDARGFSCPQPAFMTKQALNKEKQGKIEILVDNPTSRGNVIRTAEMAGWKVIEDEQKDDTYRVVVEK